MVLGARNGKGSVAGVDGPAALAQPLGLPRLAERALRRRPAADVARAVPRRIGGRVPHVLGRGVGGVVIARRIDDTSSSGGWPASAASSSASRSWK